MADAASSRYVSTGNTSRSRKRESKPVPPTRKTADSRSAATTGRQPTLRLSADLPQRDAETLEEVARATGFNKVTTLVRAIRVLAELVRAENAGGELTIKYADGRRERLIIR